MFLFLSEICVSHSLWLTIVQNGGLECFTKRGRFFDIGCVCGRKDTMEYGFCGWHECLFCCIVVWLLEVSNWAASCSLVWLLGLLDPLLDQFLLCSRWRFHSLVGFSFALMLVECLISWILLASIVTNQLWVRRVNFAYLFSELNNFGCSSLWVGVVCVDGSIVSSSWVGVVCVDGSIVSPSWVGSLCIDDSDCSRFEMCVTDTGAVFSFVSVSWSSRIEDYFDMLRCGRIRGTWHVHSDECLRVGVLKHRVSDCVGPIRCSVLGKKALALLFSVNFFKSTTTLLVCSLKSVVFAFGFWTVGLCCFWGGEGRGGVISLWMFDLVS